MKFPSLKLFLVISMIFSCFVSSNVFAGVDSDGQWPITIAGTKSGIKTLIALDSNGNLPMGVADGANIIEGSSSDTASSSTIYGKLLKLLTLLPASIGQKAMVASFPVVLASDQSAIPVTGTFWQNTQPVSIAANSSTEQTGLSAGSLNADLVPSTDVSTYKWFSLQVVGTWAGTLTFQGSNDNTNFVNIVVTNSGSTTQIITTATGNGIYTGPCNYRFLRVRMTAYTSGTATSTLELYPLASLMNVLGSLATQNGTWTVQPGNTANTTAWKVDGSAVTQPVSIATAPVLVAGEAHIGEVGGHLTSIVDNFSARPSNTTAYAVGGVWSTNLTVTGVTNASPPVATIGSHTLVAGDFVSIAGIVGATGANGNWKVGTVTGTTITLLNADGTNPSAPGVWSSGGTVAQLLVFHAGRIANGTGYITKVESNFKSVTTANGTFRITFYNATTPTALVDQSAWTVLASNFASRIGAVDMPTLQIEGAGGDSAFSMATNINLPFTSDAQGNIYAIVTAEAAYVPTSAELASWKISADQN